MSRPLDDILVVSLEQAIAAPYCTRLLADLGARVIKVERPDGGDFARAYDKRARGLSSHFVWINRSKESLTLDLKDAASVETLKALVARADVFVQNLAPGAVERLGLGPAALRRDHPRLVTCSISGYGEGGPYDGRKAYDLLVQAEAGFLSVTGTKDQVAKAGISIADIASGVTACNAILAALLHRERTGRGDHIEVSMLEAMAEWMGFPMYFALDGAEPPPRAGAGHATIYPYGPYATADGEILFGLQNDREWAAFATHVLDRTDLAGDPRFKGNAGRAGHRDLLEPIIAGALAALSTEAAMRRLDAAGIATARVNDMAALWAHPQLAARGRWDAFGSPAGPLPGLLPVSGEGWEPRFGPVPALGEHTDKILAELGRAPAGKTEKGRTDVMIPKPDRHQEMREALRDLCGKFPPEYHRGHDEKATYPVEFIDALTEAGWLAAMIPEEYGGSGLGLTEASVVMEEINRSGGNAGHCHGQMYNMGTLLRHGSEAQKRHYLPRIASGELRLQSMAVTEPTTGTDTTKLKTTAVRKGDRYVINGQKVWISRIQHSDLMILLARTTPLAEVKRKSEGLSVFLVDLKAAIGHGLTVKPIRNMVNHETNELFFDNLEIPAENLIGEEGKGFRYILDGLNAERTLIAAECIGDGYWFIDKVTNYAKERIVFDRPIGQNQGVQFPIARAYVNIEAANLMRFEAARKFDAHEDCGAEANMAKLLAADASWEAANACIQFHGGFGFAAEYDVERKFRETRLYQVAPISTNLILSYVAEHILGLPRSF